MRILEDEDIIERFKRGVISDRKFIESMKSLPDEQDDGKEPEDNRLTDILAIMAEILREIKAPVKLAPIQGATKKRKVIVNRDENGLIQSMTIEEAEDGE